MGALLATYCLDGALDNFHHEYVRHFYDPRLKYKFKKSSSRYKYGIWSDTFTKENQNETHHPENSRGPGVDMSHKSSTSSGLKHFKLKPTLGKSMKDMTNGNEIQSISWESMHALQDALGADENGNDAQATSGNFIEIDARRSTVIKKSSSVLGAVGGSGIIANATKSKLTITKSRHVLETHGDADVNTGDAPVLQLGNCTIDAETDKSSEDEKPLLEMNNHPEQF